MSRATGENEPYERFLSNKMGSSVHSDASTDNGKMKKKQPEDMTANESWVDWV